MRKRERQALDEVDAAVAAWAEARRNHLPNSPERMAAKDRYNLAVSRLVLARDRRSPYG